MFGPRRKSSDLLKLYEGTQASAVLVRLVNILPVHLMLI